MGNKEKETIRARSFTLNPKVETEALAVQCPECGEPIEGVSGPCAEYRCGCEELRKFEIRGDDE